ncbi:MAG: hypothetical protein JWR84_66 [Caulobacter sp.]|nr:hypothetical protein [Caulobacter sp.]
MTYPGALRPTLRIYGRVLKAHWPALLALTFAYPLVNWGAGLAWKALPVASGWLEIGLNGAQILAWAMAWGLMGAVLTQLTLATTDRRPADPGALLRACASALPVIAVMVLITDVTSLPLSLWRTHLAASGQMAGQAALLSILTLPFAVLDAVAFWLLALAVSVRLDQDLSLVEAMKASARLSRRRWRSMLLVVFLTGLGIVVMMTVLVIAAFARGIPADGKPPAWMTDSYLWRAPIQVLSVAWLLFWPALYVTFRDQEGAGGVAGTFE